MTKDHRPPRAHVVEVLVPVDVPQPGPVTPVHEHRLAPDRPHRPHRTVHPPGQVSTGLRVQCTALFVSHVDRTPDAMDLTSHRGAERGSPPSSKPPQNGIYHRSCENLSKVTPQPGRDSGAGGGGEPPE